MSSLVLLLLVGCGPILPASTSNPGGPAAPEARKTLMLGALNSVKGFSPWLIGTTGGGARSLFESHVNGLVTSDAQGNLEPRLAASLPSFESGTITVLADGRMQTTWKLRPNIKWHDGARSRPRTSSLAGRSTPTRRSPRAAARRVSAWTA